MAEAAALTGGSARRPRVPLAHVSAVPREPVSIVATHPIELLRAGLHVARFTWVANLALALAMVLVLA